MNKKLILWTIAVSLGGFLFGLDTAVISGAEQAIQRLWNLDSFTHGLAVAIALYGTVLGAAFGGIPADSWGRRPTLLLIGVLFLISSVGAAVVNHVTPFMFFRFLGGLSIGASSVVAPVYISEIAPPAHRGRMVIAFQMNIVFGILIAYVSNYLLDGVGGENAWRWMLGIVALPSLLFILFMWLTPESPRWLLLKKGDETAARRIIGLTEPDIDASVRAIVQSREAQPAASSARLFSGKYRWPLLLAFLMAFFNQLSGINAIIYYAPRIFEMTGLGKQGALLSSAGIGVVNLAFTIMGWWLIDRYGRRVLMYIGSVGYIISLSLVALAFFNQSYAGVPLYIFAFIAAHAIGQGSVIWVFIAEIFPTAVRAAGTAWGSLTHWVFAALIANFFPVVAEKLGGGPIFLFFTCMMVLQLLFVWRLMPETKGISLEELENRINSSQ